MSDNPIDLRGIVSPAPVAVAVPGEADCVLHNLETGTTYRLNDVGARIWELLERGHRITEIQAQLQTEYQLPEGASPQQIENDVAMVLAELHDYGLVVVEPSNLPASP